jgi:hypothetical protein
MMKPDNGFYVMGIVGRYQLCLQVEKLTIGSFPEVVWLDQQASNFLSMVVLGEQVNTVTSRG